MSLLQDIVKAWDRLERLNPYVKVRELRDRYLDTHVVHFRGDIVYSEREFNEFLDWAKETYGISLILTNDDIVDKEFYNHLPF